MVQVGDIRCSVWNVTPTSGHVGGANGPYVFIEKLAYCRVYNMHRCIIDILVERLKYKQPL